MYGRGLQGTHFESHVPEQTDEEKGEHEQHEQSYSSEKSEQTDSASEIIKELFRLVESDCNDQVGEQPMVEESPTRLMK